MIMIYSAKANSAYDLLRRDILTGVHAPGAPLRIAALSALYGLSATPLREALSRLEEKRMVVAEANKGWRVAPVSLAEMEDLEAARLTMEAALLGEAIALGDLGWESAIVAAHHRLTHAGSPVGLSDPALRQRWMEAHDAFHMALLGAARSSWLKRFYVQATEQLQRHHQALLFHPGIVNPGGAGQHSGKVQALLRGAVALGPHTRLMQATLERDAEAAQGLLRAHVEAALTVYRTILAEQGVRARSA